MRLLCLHTLSQVSRRSRNDRSGDEHRIELKGGQHPSIVWLSGFRNGRGAKRGFCSSCHTVPLEASRAGNRWKRLHFISPARLLCLGMATSSAFVCCVASIAEVLQPRRGSVSAAGCAFDRLGSVSRDSLHCRTMALRSRTIAFSGNTFCRNRASVPGSRLMGSCVHCQGRNRSSEASPPPSK